MKKKEFLNLFGKRLDKNFKRIEANEILDYYSELIDEKVFEGGNEDEIIDNFNIDEIIRDYTYELIGKKDISTIKDSYRTVKLASLRGILIPFMIPIYIILAVVIFTFSIIYFVGFILMTVPLISILLPFVEFIFFSHSIPILILDIGYILLASGLVILIGVLLFVLSKKLIIISAKCIKGLRGRREK